MSEPSKPEATELTPEQLRTCPRCHKPINPESGEACPADVKCIFAQRDHYWECTQRLQKIAASLTSEQRERAERAEKNRDGWQAKAERYGRMHSELIRDNSELSLKVTELADERASERAGREQAFKVGVWTEEESDGMLRAFYKAQEHRGMRESMFAVGAWLLRHRAAMVSTPAPPSEAQGGKGETANTDVLELAHSFDQTGTALANKIIARLETQLSTQAAEREALLELEHMVRTDRAIPRRFLATPLSKLDALRSQPTPTGEAKDVVAEFVTERKEQLSRAYDSPLTQEANGHPPVATAAEGERLIDLCPHCEKPLHFGSCEPPPASPPASDPDGERRTHYSGNACLWCQGRHKHKVPEGCAKRADVGFCLECSERLPDHHRWCDAAAKNDADEPASPPLPVELGPVELVIAELRKLYASSKDDMTPVTIGDIGVMVNALELARKTGGAR